MGFKLGLALGGGGGRGLTHIGVLEGLEKAGIKIDIIAGTSIGCVIGGLYALTLSAAEVKERVQRFIKSEEFERVELAFLKKPGKLPEKRSLSIANVIRRGIFFSLTATTKGFMPEEEYLKIFDSLIGDALIENTKIPFSCVAADLDTGKEVVLNRGSLKRAANASAAIPGVYPPVLVDGYNLVDGSWVNIVPVRAAFDAGATMVIAVDVAREKKETAQFKTGLEVFIRANEITREKLKQIQLKEAQIVIAPDVDDVHWADFSQMELCIERGNEAVENCSVELKRKIILAKTKQFFLM